jgi:hypothetical protein
VDVHNLVDLTVVDLHLEADLKVVDFVVAEVEDNVPLQVQNHSIFIHPST